MKLVQAKKHLRSIKDHYRSEKHNLGRDFFAPCLESFVLYRRAAGYFSSTALRTWADCLPRLAVESASKIHLLISPELSKNDLQTLRSATDETEREKLLQKSTDEFIEQVLAFQATPAGKKEADLRAQLLAWLIAKKKLELRFAINLYEEEEKGIFHKKIGIFDYPWGDMIAFTGSANESVMAHEINSESVDVYRSWIRAEKQRVATKIEEFEEVWNAQSKNLLVRPISSASLKLIKVVAPEMPPHPKLPKPNPKPFDTEEQLWPHQKAAIKTFLTASHGILQMATGTGKTRVALEIASALKKSGQIQFAVVAVEGNDLLDQWFKKLLSWTFQQGFSRCYRHYGSYHERDNFLLDPINAILLCSRNALPSVFKELRSTHASTKALIIQDEVHDLGSPSCIATLSGGRNLFDYRLGLSATPEREYDQAGNNFITREIGKSVFKFDLHDAIKARVLCPLSYESIPYKLTQSDRQALARVWSRDAALKKAGTPWAKEQLWMEISRVYKRSQDKITRFESFLSTKPKDFLKRTLIFVEDKKFADELYDIIHAKTHSYSAYYAEDEPEVLQRFIIDDLDCLITCHKLSQGIDVRSVRKVILFSSARSKLETIQRLGRCLRTDPADPNKIALVVDFVLVNDRGKPDPQGIDHSRYRWLSALSKIRPK